MLGWDFQGIIGFSSSVPTGLQRNPSYLELHLSNGQKTGVSCCLPSNKPAPIVSSLRSEDKRLAVLLSVSYKTEDVSVHPSKMRGASVLGGCNLTPATDTFKPR